MTIENLNNQLKITYDSGVVEYYSFSDIKSVSPYYNYGGDAYAVINFINENRNSSLKLPLSLLTGRTEIESVISDISTWMSGLPTEANRRANILRTSDAGEIGFCYSFSISNVGIADGVAGAETLKPGETINFDAGAIGNIFTAFEYDATDTEFLIIYVS